MAPAYREDAAVVIELRRLSLRDPLLSPLLEGLTAEYEARYGRCPFCSKRRSRTVLGIEERGHPCMHGLSPLRAPTSMRH